MFTRSLATFLAASLLSITTVHAVEHKPYSDEQIRSIILHDLGAKEISGVAVEVSAGVVTLRGNVRDAWEKDTAIQIATGIHDVKAVSSELTVRGPESDEQLSKDVGRAVQRYVFYSVFDSIDASVQDGVVTLSGEVTWSFKSSEIANHVAHVPGVKEVRNDIRVLPTSPDDDEMRARLAVAIYRDLPELANQVVPPIHIIVENGRVTLTGAVRDNVEKIRAEYIARSTFGVFSVVNRLQVAP